MKSTSSDTRRGMRLRNAMTARGRRKVMALAAELGVSPAALSKWRQGHAMSADHACKLSVALDVSLDWLLMGRDAGGSGGLTPLQFALIAALRRRPERIVERLAALVAEIPETGGGDGN